MQWSGACQTSRYSCGRDPKCLPRLWPMSLPWLMTVCVSQAMKAVEVPIYDFSSHQRAQHTQHVEPSDVVIIEGILVLHMPEVRKMLNMKIFVVSHPAWSVLKALPDTR